MGAEVNREVGKWKPEKTINRIVPRILVRALLILVLAGLSFEFGVRLMVRENRGQLYVLGKSWRPLFPLTIPSYQARSNAYGRYDPELGWTLSPNRRVGLYATDRHGVRCRFQSLFHSCWSTTDEPIIGAFGDSFTHGDEVEYEQTWPYILEKELGEKVINFGVPGYGVDQAILRFERWSRRVRMKTAIVALVPGDLARNASVFREILYLHPTLKAKPRFIRKHGGEIARMPERVPHPAEVPDILRRFDQTPYRRYEDTYVPGMFRTGVWDRSYAARFIQSLPIWRARRRLEQPIQSLLQGGSLYQLNLAILRRFVRDARDAGILPVVLLLAEEDALRAMARKGPGFSPWRRTVESISKPGVLVVDLSRIILEIYRKKGRDGVFNHAGVHYTPQVHRRIARELARVLRHLPEATERDLESDK